MAFFLQYSLDELCRDTDSLFKLVLSDPQFEGILPNLSHSTATEAVPEAVGVLCSAPAPQVHWVWLNTWLLQIEGQSYRVH